jgi:hypothetical protein
MVFGVGTALGKLVWPVVVMGFAFAIFLLARSAHHAGNDVGNALTTPVGQASLATGETNLVSADRSVARYYADNLTYVGLTSSYLQKDLPGTAVTVARADTGSYCLETTISGVVTHLTGPGGLPAAGPC